jgi:hypothetical protein
MTVPWSARRHHIPHDYHRFSRERLQQLFLAHGFTDVCIRERGNDIGVIANKLIVLSVRLMRSQKMDDAIWSIPLSIPVGIMATIMLVVAHVSMCLGRGSLEDPLGYFVRAVRKNSEYLSVNNDATQSEE